MHSPIITSRSIMQYLQTAPSFYFNLSARSASGWHGMFFIYFHKLLHEFPLASLRKPCGFFPLFFTGNPTHFIPVFSTVRHILTQRISYHPFG